MAPLALRPLCAVLSGTFRYLQWPLYYLLIFPRQLGGDWVGRSRSYPLGLSQFSEELGLAFDIRPICRPALLVLPLVRWWRAGRHLESPVCRRATDSTDRLGCRRLHVRHDLWCGDLPARRPLVLGCFQGARVTGFYSLCIRRMVCLFSAICGSDTLVCTTRPARCSRPLPLDYTNQHRVSSGCWRFCVSSAASFFIFGHALSIEATPLRIIGMGVLVYVSSWVSNALYTRCCLGPCQAAPRTASS